MESTKSVIRRSSFVFNEATGQLVLENVPARRQSGTNNERARGREEPSLALLRAKEAAKEKEKRKHVQRKEES